MIERNRHLCCSDIFWDVSETSHMFSKNFKILFQIKDKALFDNPNYNFDIDDVHDILEKTQ